MATWTAKAIDYTERVTEIEHRIKRVQAIAVRDGWGKTKLAAALAPLRTLRSSHIAKALRADKVSARTTHVEAEKRRAKRGVAA